MNVFYDIQQKYRILFEQSNQKQCDDVKKFELNFTSSSVFGLLFAEDNLMLRTENIITINVCNYTHFEKSLKLFMTDLPFINSIATRQYFALQSYLHIYLTAGILNLLKMKMTIKIKCYFLLCTITLILGKHKNIHISEFYIFYNSILCTIYRLSSFFTASHF